MYRNIPDRAPAWPIGAVLFSLALSAAFVGYAADVHGKARGATDWMMVMPAAGIGVVALLVSMLEDLRGRYRVQLADGGEDGAQTLRTLLFMALLCLYVAAIPFAGFDLASFVFLGAGLIVQGERRLWACLVFAAAVTVPVVWVFIHVLGVPLPTVLF